MRTLEIKTVTAVSEPPQVCTLIRLVHTSSVNCNSFPSTAGSQFFGHLQHKCCPSEVAKMGVEFIVPVTQKNIECNTNTGHTECNILICNNGFKITE